MPRYISYMQIIRLMTALADALPETDSQLENLTQKGFENRLRDVVFAFSTQHNWHTLKGGWCGSENAPAPTILRQPRGRLAGLVRRKNNEI